MVDARQGERVFGAGLVDTGIIDTHSPLPILLEHQDWVGQLVRVVNFHDEADNEQPGYFFPYYLPPFFCEVAQGLFDRFCVWPDM